MVHPQVHPGPANQDGIRDPRCRQAGQRMGAKADYPAEEAPDRPYPAR
jgi:hypothetical protein